VETEDGWVNKNWRRDKTLQREHREEGIPDTLSLTRSEICALGACPTLTLEPLARSLRLVYKQNTLANL
jgi:hypothetical protein